jgi:sugar lactone lactonase YvrE
MSRNGVTWAEVAAPDGLLFEGPQWVPGARVFQWVDILAGSVHRWDPYAGGASENRSTGLEFATVALPLDADRSLVASRNSLHVHSWTDSGLEEVGRWEFPRDVRFNDGAVAPNGDIYVGTMSMERRKCAAALYRFDLGSGSLVAVLEGIGISNGLAWDSATTAYYVDSLSPQIDRLETSGSVVSRSLWRSLAENDEPDGLALASDGAVVVAVWGGGRLEVLHQAGQGPRAVEVPSRFPTSLTFGGVEGEWVLVTTANDPDTDSPGRALLCGTTELLEAHA